MKSTGPNVVTHTGIVHATSGMIRSYGRLFPRPICGAGRNVRHYFMKTEDEVTCQKCRATLEKQER